MNEPRGKRILIIASIVFGVIVVGLLLYFFIASRYPSTQYAEKTVIIDNYKDYTEHISPGSFGYLHNYLYEFIKDPSKPIYHAEISNNSYSYNKDSWFSKFVVKVKDSDISWSVSMQTLDNGEVNGDISVTCLTGNCISFSERVNSTTALQDALPITTNDYIISQGSASYESLSIVYYDNEGIGKTKALEEIKSRGFKPEDYKIEYFYGGR